MRARRARSPLRWLWVITSAPVLLGLAGITGQLWLIALIPLVVAAILFSPPLGVFHHDEIPPPRTDAYIVAREVEPRGDVPPGGRCFALTLHNDGTEAAENFRIRILVPAALWPRGTRGSPLMATDAGRLGRHWFTEAVSADTSITFRAGDPREPDAIICPMGGSLALATLLLVNLAHFAGDALEYQINGGTVRTVLGRLVLPLTQQE